MIIKININMLYCYISREL